MSATRPSPSATGRPARSSARLATAGPWIGRIALVALPVLVLGLLVWPLIVAGGQVNGEDWPTHLWFIAHQAEALRHDLRPSLFVGYDEGVFYPQYAFYGGSLYALTGGLAVLVGDDRAAYVIAYVAGFAGAYGGWFWLGRQAGLGPWRAQAPAVLFTTSAYFLTVVYTRGDWPELMAIAALPVVVAASISVLRDERLRAGPAAALAAGTVVFTGSHALTLVYGALFLIVLAGILLAALRPARAVLSRAAVGRWLSVVVPATLVNGWFLWPLAAYGTRTRIGSDVAVSDENLRSTAALAAPEHIFTLGRKTAQPGLPEFVLTLPVLAIAWVVVGTALALLWRRTRTAWTAAALVFVLLAGALLLVMTNVGVILALPSTLRALQFSYRLETYILLCVAGAMLCLLVVLGTRGRGPRAFLGALVAVLAVSTLGAAAQVDHRLRGDRAFPYAEFSFPVSVDYVDGGLPLVAPSGLQAVRFAFDGSQDRPESVTVPAAPGQLLATNIMSARELLDVDGARPVAQQLDRARTGGGLPHMVLEVDGDAVPGAAQITISAARPLPVRGGELLSVLGLLGLVAVFARIALRARRGRAAAGSA